MNSNSDYTLVGEIRLFPYEYTPEGFLPCDGQPVEVNANNAPLYALLGNRFGGTPNTDFNLPNLNQNLPNSQCRYYIAMRGQWPARS